MRDYTGSCPLARKAMPGAPDHKSVMAGLITKEDDDDPRRRENERK